MTDKERIQKGVSMTQSQALSWVIWLTLLYAAGALIGLAIKFGWL